MGVNKGALVHDVTIQQLSVTTGPSHTEIKTWPTLQTAWMSRPAQTGMERFAAAQVSATATQTWEMPYLASMDPDLVDVPKSRRLFYLGRSYDIVRVEHLGRQERLRITTLAASKVA